jgi:adenine-specific DNA-methyltransferase
VPFLNGGVFECLDDRVQRGNSAFAYGDPGRRRETVRPLLSILRSYNFTLAENTPIEQEIALDPELLGHVFENLLAAYNP